MLSIEKFNEFAGQVNIKPFSFWPEEWQREIINNLESVLGKIRGVFEDRKLVNNHAYRAVVNLERIIDDGFNELEFLQGLSALMEIYQMSIKDKKQKKVIAAIAQQVGSAKNKVLEYHVSLESLEEKGEEMDEEEIRQKDLETIKKVGIFYILEYTVYVLYMLTQLDEGGREKIFYEGLKTAEANLPPYTEFADSFRRDFGYKIFDPELRDKILKIFFQFEEAFNGGDLKAIMPAFKKFNLELAKVYIDQGIDIFETAILSPFGENIPMTELIEKIESIDFN